MRVLVITSCTGEKQYSPESELLQQDFAEGSAHLKSREQELSEYLCKAEDIYTGLQHQRLMRGVRALRKRKEEFKVDFHVLSAGYGLIKGSKKIAPYECTFSGMKAAELRSWAELLGVPASIRKLMAQPYDLALVLLGDGYLRACALNDQVELGGPTVFFAGKASAARLPRLRGARSVILTNAEAKRFKCGLVGLKGEVGARLLEKLASDPASVTSMADPATDLLQLVDGEEVAVTKRSKARANPEVDHIIDLPASWDKKPHRKRLRYFIPEWDDLVDPDYDFENDIHSGGSGDWSNQVYAHQMYPAPNYDGILISKVVAEASKKKKDRINAMGVHRFLRVPRSIPIMGDCGAFGYVKEKVPPYTTSEILDYYTRLDFDYGVSIDHLIVAATESEKLERYQLTINNAQEFLTEHRKRKLTWTPIGAVQGWDPQSYADAAQKIVAMGYDYIALGGLVRSSTPKIIEVLHKVREVVPDGVSLHLFGVARLNAVDEFRRLGVTSVDSASYLRQAWMRSKDSYILPNGTTYAAIRIPEAGKSFRAKHMRQHSDLAEETIVRLERAALDAVRAYALRKTTVKDCLDALMEYDQFVTSDRQDMREFYRKTLEDRPWEQCDCDVCRSAGIEVVIFRGNNRNRRRGFHNTYSFYQLFQRAVMGEEIVIRQGKGDVSKSDQLKLFPVQAAVS